MEHYPTYTREQLLILESPWEIHRLGVAKLKSMGFINTTDEDIDPYKPKDKKRERSLES